MRLRGAAAAVALTASLAGGALAGPPPQGAGVVASVAGTAITPGDMRVERQSLGPREASDDFTVLQRIIMRRLLVTKARDAGLDKAPDFDAQARRAVEVLLAQQYERNVAVASNPPTGKEIHAFMAGRPGMFAERRIAIVDQIIARPADLTTERFKPLRTLDAVKALLVAEKTPFEESWAVLDTLTADPAIVVAINKLPQGEVLAIPNGRNVVFNRIQAQRTALLSSDLAVAYATKFLLEQRKREALSREFQAIRSAGEPLIEYAPGYAPPAPQGR
jgi:EpsD family peptidyl-prolyl cis-trans isomerase